MQSTHISAKGKGKGRAGEEDYAQSLGSLSLSDYGDRPTPSNDSYGSSYTDVYGSSYEQPYIADDHYSWTAQSSLAPMQSSSVVFSGTSGNDSSYPTIIASSTEGYEHQNEPTGYTGHDTASVTRSTVPSSYVGASVNGWIETLSHGPVASAATPTYSGYTEYDTASVTSSSVPSSYGQASISGWSETYSRGTAASSIPSAHSNRTDVNNTIHRQHPPIERYQLPCEFWNLTGCKRVFAGDDVQGWMDHVEGHLQSKFPTRLRCWFCNEHNFDARETSKGDVRSNFNMRMHHIRNHITYEGYRPDQMHRDGLLVQHLLDRNLIDRRTYESIVNPTTVPPVPGSQGRHSRFRSHHPLLQLPVMPSPSLMSNGQSNVPPRWKMEQSQLQQPFSSLRHRHSPSISSLKQYNQNYNIDKKTAVLSTRLVSPPTHSPVDSGRPGQPALVSSAGPASVEGEAVAESSSRHRRENKGQIPGTRPAPSEGGSKQARRNREVSELISAPAVVYPDDAALRLLEQLPSSLYSSLKLMENLSLEGSSGSSRNTSSTRKHSEDHSIGHAGDETVAKAAMSELQQIDSELVRKESTCSTERIESPQSQDHSNDGLSIYSTDTSTPESGSFWSAEYSEEEDNKLDEDHIFNQFRASATARVIEAFNAWRENHLNQDLPSDGAGGTGKANPAPNQSKGKGNDSATKKRTWADQTGISEETADNSGPSSNQVGSSKRPQTSAQQLLFACPYTKKDPRSHGACYKYKLSRIRDVKQHLVRRHRNPLYCPVCMSIFQTEEERDGHVRERSCESRPAIRLDGITESQRFQLAKKSAAHSTEEAQWYAVFDIVFPGHQPRPLSPYVNPELIQDITLFENFLMSDGPRVVSDVFTQHGASDWNLPDEERERAAFLRPVFDEGFSLICEQWRARSSSSSQDSNLPSGSGSSSQNTPPSSSCSREGVDPRAVRDSGAVPPVTAGSPPDGGPLDALFEGVDIPENSADHFSFGEGLDETFGFQHNGVEFPAGRTYGVDDMMRPMTDDAEAGSSFQLGWTEPAHHRSEHRRGFH
ncbi:hypothetical protein INS49_014190 [Diaporthe citri]|uniref:uncharacterized protein n=1 Tax=Diaporthe citri TaxID=83186 RepID=UPI001C825690|nr:uncharacterized protein INS49_014190 [Diaporthe citri]KAG6358306.1 hypothetical protein INS49_014190 [Diaporthe citri]